MLKLDNTMRPTYSSIAGLKAILGIVLIGTVACVSLTTQANDTGKSNSPCIEAFAPAFQSSDFISLSQLFAKPPSADICSEATLEQIRDRASQKVAGAASRLLSESGETDSALALLSGKRDATFRLAAIWHVNAVRGDIEMAKENWSEASNQYQNAYELSLGSATGAMGAREAASVGVQEKLYLLASESMQLAGDFGMAISRSGDASGIFGTRGVKPKSVPVPVEFDFDSDTLTASSARQIDIIVSFLQNRGYRELEVIGHTDWKGSEEYNLDLSERRARRLASAIQEKYTRSAGQALTINSRGVGETCPRVISDASRYTEEQLASLYRRVALQWVSESQSQLHDCDQNGIRR